MHEDLPSKKCVVVVGVVVVVAITFSEPISQWVSVTFPPHRRCLVGKSSGQELHAFAVFEPRPRGPAHLHPPPQASWLENPNFRHHSFLIFILFFPVPPVLLLLPLSFSVRCVYISPAPLSCHQLAPSVSNRADPILHVFCYSDCFLPDHRRICMAAAAFHQHIHMHYNPPFFICTRNIDISLCY